MDNLSPPPKKIENPQTQPINADVGNLLKNKGKTNHPPEVEQTKERILKILQTAKVNPQELISLGKYAKQAARNPELYPMVVDFALKNQLITQDMVKGKGIDYQLLSIGVTLGKLTEELVKEGKI